VFDHLLFIVYVADMERSLALYRDVLGGEEIYRFPRDGAPEHVELRIGAAVLALTSEAGRQSHHLPPATPGHPFELAVRATDADAAIATLMSAGCSLLIEPFDSSAGNRVGYVLDPDGNRLQIYSNR
jgi:lactoylglutathione lyase